jgi:hypothetical protein
MLFAWRSRGFFLWSGLIEHPDGWYLHDFRYIPNNEAVAAQCCFLNAALKAMWSS